MSTTRLICSLTSLACMGLAVVASFDRDPDWAAVLLGWAAIMRLHAMPAATEGSPR